MNLKLPTQPALVALIALAVDAAVGVVISPFIAMLPAAVLQMKSVVLVPLILAAWYIYSHKKRLPFPEAMQIAAFYFLYTAGILLFTFWSLGVDLVVTEMGLALGLNAVYAIGTVVMMRMFVGLFMKELDKLRAEHKNKTKS